MPTHLNHIERDTFFFITFTCYKWLNLFAETNIYDYLPFWFEKLRKKGCNLCGYVIMPNHFHLLLHVNSEVKNLSLVIAESKRFLAYEIVKRLKENGKVRLLDVLKAGVTAKEKEKGKKHQVFRLSFDAKPIDSSEVGRVLDYIHLNPVSKKWRIVEDYTDYPHSSAGFYECGKKAKYSLVDFRELVPGSSESSVE
ncbi:transposase [Reichenbachiella sp.]|uniref:transposase n=1 Tax=Reichenbachiella sp. TaxID=2184521 RepID=UPI003B5C0123